MKRLVLILLAVPTLSFAQSTAEPAEADAPAEVDAASGRKVLYQKATEIDFESLDVDGELIKPSTGYVFERKRTVFPSLVELRKDFNLEMSSSLDHVK